MTTPPPFPPDRPDNPQGRLSKTMWACIILVDLIFVATVGVLVYKNFFATPQPAPTPIPAGDFYRHEPVSTTPPSAAGVGEEFTEDDEPDISFEMNSRYNFVNIPKEAVYVEYVELNDDYVYIHSRGEEPYIEVDEANYTLSYPIDSLAAKAGKGYRKLPMKLKITLDREILPYHVTDMKIRFLPDSTRCSAHFKGYVFSRR